jgi:hypothetical protein
MILTLDAFNATNRTNLSVLNTGQYSFRPEVPAYRPNPDFLAPVEAFDPRILQLGVRVTF